MVSPAPPPEFSRIKLPWCFRGEVGTTGEPYPESPPALETTASIVLCRYSQKLETGGTGGVGYGRYHLFLRKHAQISLTPQTPNEHSGWPAPLQVLQRPVQIPQLSLPGLWAAEPSLLGCDVSLAVCTAEIESRSTCHPTELSEGYVKSRAMSDFGSRCRLLPPAVVHG